MVNKATKRGVHRKQRERAPWSGMMLHQVCLLQAGTQSSLRGVREVVEYQGLFCSFYTDRGRHYWHTPEAGGKVDQANPTPFGRAMAPLGIERIPAYSPEARGRSERALRTHQDRLVRATGGRGYDRYGGH